MQFMDVASLIRSVSPSALIGILVLLPALSGLLVFAVRLNAARVGIVIVTAWVVPGASLTLFLWGALEQRSLLFTPLPVSGVSWDLLILLGDGALLLLCILGAARRSPLIFALALLQAGGLLWLEMGRKPPHADAAALVADWLAIIMTLIVSVIGMIIATYALPEPSALTCSRALGAPDAWRRARRDASRCRRRMPIHPIRSPIFCFRERPF